MFEIRINSNKAWAVNRETLTRLGKNYDAVKIRLGLSSEWEDLSKIAVFRAQDAMIDVPVMGEYLDIPPVMLQRENVHLLFGLYGVGQDGAVVIPTIWTDLGIVQPSPDPYGADNYEDPPASLYAQLEAMAEAAAEDYAAAASGIYLGTGTLSINSAGHLIFTLEQDGVTTPTDLGTVTAYAAAKEEEPDLSYEEFKRMLLASDTAQDVAGEAWTKANTVEGVAQQASQNATQARIDAINALQAATAANTAVAGKQDKVIKNVIHLSSASLTNVGCQGVTPDSLVIWSPAPDSLETAAENNVVLSEQLTDKVNFTAEGTWEDTITINVAIFN